MPRADSTDTTIASDALLDGERMRAAMRRLRKHAEEAAERLISLMDAIDGDPDLEDGADGEPDQDDEPSLGWSMSEAGGGAGPTGIEVDREEESDGREDGHDAEHDMADWEWSLGWSNGIYQGFGDQGLGNDREGPDDDREPDSFVCDPRDPIDQRELENPVHISRAFQPLRPVAKRDGAKGCPTTPKLAGLYCRYGSLRHCVA